MNIRQLEVFRAVMYGGSTKNAARLLLISQPAVSNMVRQFEDQIGFALFDRVRGRLRPTAEAKILYEKSDEIFARFNALEDLVDDLKDAEAGTLKIMASPSIGHTVLPALIASFTQERPQVKIKFDTLSHETLVDALYQEQADIALTITPIEHPAIVSRTLKVGQLLCVFPKNHRLAKRKIIRNADLDGLKLISYPRFSPIGSIVEESFHRAGIVQKIGIEVRFCLEACNLVNEGVGVAIVDEFTPSTNMFKNLDKRPLQTTQRVDLTLSHPAKAPLSTLARHFISNFLMPYFSA